MIHHNPLAVRIIFWLSVISLALFLGLAGYLYLQGQSSSNWLSENALLKVTLNMWMGTATVIWFYGFYKVAKFWNQRTTLMNLLFVGVLFMFSWFAAYYFYLRKEVCEQS